MFLFWSIIAFPPKGAKISIMSYNCNYTRSAICFAAVIFDGFQIYSITKHKKCQPKGNLSFPKIKRKKYRKRRKYWKNTKKSKIRKKQCNTNSYTVQ